MPKDTQGIKIFICYTGSEKEDFIEPFLFSQAQAQKQETTTS